MNRLSIRPTLFFCFVLTALVSWGAPLKVLIIDGQNNHDWEATTPELKRILEETGRFQADVATTPPAGGDMSAFQPEFGLYDVVVSNYNGESWSAATNAAFEEYVRQGGGFVAYHAADNAFPGWKEYNEMIAIGGWGGRTEAHGASIHFEDNRVQYDYSPGKAGSHGRRHAFLIVTRDPKHPIMSKLPNAWMHASDELYDSLKGPARDLDLLATAYSDPKAPGTGRNEPILLAIRYGKGRVFHTTLGHDVAAMRCVGFITTLQRGAEWAATGRVKQKVPKDFPTMTRVSTRE